MGENFELGARTLELRTSDRALNERAAARGETRFEAGRAVAADTRPRLGAVQIAAAASRVPILHLLEVEVLFPVGPFFGEWGRAKACFHPAHAAVRIFARSGHVAEILVARNRSSTERFAADRVGQRRRFAAFHACRHQVAYVTIVARNG